MKILFLIFSLELVFSQNLYHKKHKILHNFDSNTIKVGMNGYGKNSQKLYYYNNNIYNFLKLYKLSIPNFLLSVLKPKYNGGRECINHKNNKINSQ